jgi:hypothetical protein
MTATKYETAPCPPGAICTPQGRDHVVSYEFKLDRANAPRRPFVVHGEIGGVDICLDVKVELEIRTRMSSHGGGSQGAKGAQVNLHPRIDLEPCSTYFRTDMWLGGRAGFRARQEILHQFHAEIVEAFGGEEVLEGWKKLENVPANVTVLGASIEDVRNYVNKKLAELGNAGDTGHAGPDGHRGRGRRSGAGAGRRSKVFQMKPARRRGSAGRAGHGRHQRSKSNTPSRAR